VHRVLHNESYNVVVQNFQGSDAGGYMCQAISDDEAQTVPTSGSGDCKEEYVCLNVVGCFNFVWYKLNILIL
jgi:hypothetical protein